MSWKHIRDEISVTSDHFEYALSEHGWGESDEKPGLWKTWLRTTPSHIYQIQASEAHHSGGNRNNSPVENKHQ